MGDRSRSRARHGSRRLPTRRLPDARRRRPGLVVAFDARRDSDHRRQAVSVAPPSPARVRDQGRYAPSRTSCPAARIQLVPTDGSTSRSSRRTRSSIGWVGRIPSRPGTRTGSPGGLYGIGIGGLFAAESKFHRRSGASKAALLSLLLHLRDRGGARLIDVQWATPHLRSLGAVEITRAEYHARLDELLAQPDAFAPPSRRESQASGRPRTKQRERARSDGTRLHSETGSRTAGRCRSSTRSRTTTGRALCRRSIRARRSRGRLSAR